MKRIDFCTVRFENQEIEHWINQIEEVLDRYLISEDRLKIALILKEVYEEGEKYGRGAH